MNILEKIVVHKKQEVTANKATVSVEKLEQSPLFSRTCFSLINSIKTRNGIIAEFKRQSPSKGIINSNSQVQDVVLGYQQAGVSGVSVLTDKHFFGGSNQDLIQARTTIKIPILRKDFIISEYQIIEAKSIGADVILLIAAILDKKQIKAFTTLAHSLGLQVLLEVHNQEELDKYISEIKLVGINNRNLKTFEVDFENAISLSKQLPLDTLKIAESGINDYKNILKLKKHQFNGFLIGENFMKTSNPAQACYDFVQQLNNTTHEN
jgi:indole-3-glycerol phosphate synthase